MPWSRTNQLILAAAARLGVDAEPLSATETDFFLRLRVRSGSGSGSDRAVIISKTRSPFLTQVAQTLSNNKRISRELLGGRGRGLPVPPDLLVDDGTPEEPAIAAGMAFIAAHGAVVVKPNWGNRGLGLSAGIRSEAALRRAIVRAQAADRDEEALIEPELAGTNLRVAVIGGRAEAVAEIRRPWLRGDGQRSARALLAELNRDPRRSGWQRQRLVALDEIPLDEGVAEHLEVHGLTAEDPLPPGFAVEIIGEELEVIDRSDEIDPGWAALAVAACDHLGVDVGGVDLRGPLENFCRPPDTGADAWRRGTLLEVNVLPALHFHALPTAGRPRPVFEAFVAYCLSLPGAPPPRAAIGAAGGPRIGG